MRKGESEGRREGGSEGRREEGGKGVKRGREREHMMKCIEIQKKVRRNLYDTISSN